MKIGYGFFGGSSPLNSQGAWSEFYQWDEVEDEQQELDLLIEEAENQRERDEAHAWDLYLARKD